jgi:hypothetical protein
LTEGRREGEKRRWFDVRIKEYDVISVPQEKLVAFVICGIAKRLDTYTNHSHNVD